MIKLNDAEILKYTSEYNDNPDTVKTDSYALDGTMERQRYDDKQQVKMTYDMATPELVRYFKDLESQGVVKFYNDQSAYGTLEFEGIMTVETGSYYHGGTLLTTLNVMIREV